MTASTLFRSDDPSTAFRLFLLLSIPASIGAAALTGGGGGIALIASLIAAAVPIGWIDVPTQCSHGAERLSRIAVLKPSCDFPLEALEPVKVLVAFPDLVVGLLSGDGTFRGVESVGMRSIDLPPGVVDTIAAPPADREPIVR